MRPRIAGLDELHLAAERQGRSTFVLVTAVPRPQPSAHALRSEYKHPRSLERRSASLKDPEVVDPFFLQKPERAQALGYVPLMVCLIFRALARRVRQTAAPLATIARGPVVHPAGLEVLRRLAATVVRLPDAARGLRVAPALRPTCDAILQRCRVPVAAYTPLPPSPRPPPGSPPDAEIRNGGPRRAEYAPRGVSSAEARAAAREARPPPPRPHGPFGARRAGGRRLGQDAAGSHAAWQGEARRLFARIPALLARYGLAAGAELRLADDPATPYSYYDRERGVIGASLPDAGTPAGRLFWLFLTALLEVPSEAEALAFGRWLLVYVLGHETGHHLRHRYGADTADRWLEEHVANELGLGLALLFPRFRRQLPTMAALVFRAAGRLGALGGPHLAWAHRDLGETLLATGILDEETLRQAERLAREAGLPPEAVLEAAGVPAEALRTAERERAEVAAHLRNAYLSDLMEYGAFHLTWLADLLRQPELPDLGTSAATHLLTPAWEDRRRHAARLFLRRTITADTPAAAGAVAALAREADNAELAWLVAAYPQRTPDVQAAILRALVPRPPVPALVTACERLLADGGGGGLRAAAALYLLRHRPQALRSAAAGSVWRALADGPGAARAAGRPPRALVAEPEAALPALREAVAAVPERLEGLPVAAWMRPLLRHDDAAVRIAALGVLAEPAVAGQRDGLHGLAQAVAGLAGSARAGERRAALAVLEQWSPSERRTLLLPPLAAVAAEARRWAGLAGAAARFGCPATLRDLLRSRHEAERSRGLDIALAMLDGAARQAARAAVEDGPGSLRMAGRLLAEGLPADARPAVATLLEADDPAPPTPEAWRSELLGCEDALVRAAARRALAGAGPPAMVGAGPAPTEAALQLRAADAFRDLGSEALLALAARSRRWSAAAGEVVPAPGDGAPSLHVLLSGRAELPAPAGGRQAAWPLRPGDVFGEECLWTDTPPTWRVRCAEGSRWASVDGRTLRSVCLEEPLLPWRLAAEVARRLRRLPHPPRSAHRHRLHGQHPHRAHHPAARSPFTEAEKLAHLIGLPLLQAAGGESLQALLPAFETVDLAAGEAAVRAGVRTRRFWVIARGHMVLSVPGTALSERLGPGDSFGEASLLDGGGEPWDAVAAGPCRLLTADGKAFLWAARGHQGLPTALLRALHHRWRDTWAAAGPPTPGAAP